MKKNYFSKKWLIITFLLLIITLHAKTSEGITKNINNRINADFSVVYKDIKINKWFDQNAENFKGWEITLVKQPAYSLNAFFFQINAWVDFDLDDDAILTMSSITSCAYNLCVEYNGTVIYKTNRRALLGSANWLIGTLY